MTDRSDKERLAVFRRHQEKERMLREKALRDSIDARKAWERLRRLGNTA
jgi:hypothetical protein